MASVLSLRNIAKHFYSRGMRVNALDPVTVDVEDGEFLTVVGPSGCGKSTLLNLLAGLTTPSGGEIVYKGRALSGINTEIGYVTQADNLLPWRTLIANVELGLEVQGMSREERRRRALQLVEKVGLGGFENHFPHELSGGMRQRANIIRTLIYDPDVILMDEPFGPLDALTRGNLQDQLLRLWQEARKTVIFVTHDLVEAIALADRVVVMTARPGRIKSITPVDIPRPRDVFHIHSSPQFRAIYDRVWDDVLAEVKQGVA